jgi:hypothetical protein
MAAACARREGCQMATEAEASGPVSICVVVNFTTLFFSYKEELI